MKQAAGRFVEHFSFLPTYLLKGSFKKVFGRDNQTDKNRGQHISQVDTGTNSTD